ncbi:Non-specific serine/threonine protein kinase [Sulfidibacter corallicola]|uniref:Tetratricopeptide repeat protein n=1 Tax=Sulfidibacter corallicola TaxID=2818388 RepID=A0A8A4THE2_SULCO|nr:serine/threonine-protein kinase [Sulfidibacter corallicola]QTD49053.1 tetratricopeptide repeat protein [Sulfidibacter corallicola]
MSGTLKRERKAFDLLMEILALEQDRRVAVLSEKCGDDRELFELVRARLAVEEELDFSMLLGDQPPERLGNYRILGVLGEGGMGLIYEAVREDETALPVAIKILRRHLESSVHARRFVMERRILGQLKHPHICQIYDSNLTPAGQPYFVMERIRGEHLDVHCVRFGLDLNQRLDLFLKICDAVAFAHKKLVIHRDLKPANILVDQHGMPKLLDFGIASLIDPETGYQQAVTEAAGRVLTPLYASPEQLRSQPLSTASDIFTLGILLCEMITGCRPFHRSEGSPLELLERMNGGPAPLASSLLRSTLPAQVPPWGWFERDRSDAYDPGPVTWVTKLRGDLDCIVGKALAFDPEDRYQSVADLAGDIVRYQNDVPILARPSSWRYRTRCFVRRNRLSVTAALFTTMMAVLFSAALYRQWRMIDEERRINAQTSQFIQDIFVGADPFAMESTDLSVEFLLENASNNLEEAFGDRPEMQARLASVLGLINRQMGFLETAEPLLARAYRLERERHGVRHPVPIKAGMELGLLYLEQGRVEEAIPLLTAAESFFEEAPTNAAGRDYAKALINRGRADLELGRWKAVEARIRKARSILDTIEPVDVEDISEVNNLWGILLFQTNRLAEAEEVFRQNVLLWKRHRGAEHLMTISAQSNLANVYSKLGAYDKALDVTAQSIRIARTRLGSKHPTLAGLLVSLGNLHFKADHHEASRVAFEEALAIRRERLGEDHPKTTTIKNNLAAVLQHDGDLFGSREYYREVLQDWTASRGEQHPDTELALRNLAFSELMIGNPETSARLAARAVAAGAAFGETDPVPGAKAYLWLGRALLESHEYDEAARALDRSRSLFRSSTNHGTSRDRPLLELARLRYAMGNLTESADRARLVLHLNRNRTRGLRMSRANGLLASIALSRGDTLEAACYLGIDTTAITSSALPSFEDYYHDLSVARYLAAVVSVDAARARLVDNLERTARRYGEETLPWFEVASVLALYENLRVPSDLPLDHLADLVSSHTELPERHRIVSRIEAVRLLRRYLTQPSTRHWLALKAFWRGEDRQAPQFREVRTLFQRYLVAERLKDLDESAS